MFWQLMLSISGSVLGTIILSWLYHRRVERLLQQRADHFQDEFIYTRERLVEMERENASLREELSAVQSRYELAEKFHAEQIRSTRESSEQLQLQFETLARKIFDESTGKLEHLARSKLLETFAPLREQLQQFRQRIESIHETQLRQHSALGQELEQIRQLNRVLAEDAQKLSEALRSSGKVQGDWGEVVLERILESAGLAANREYRLQVHFTGREGERLRPDAVVYLPRNRAVVIDAKVSLTAYLEYSQLDETEKDQREQAVKRHLLSVRQHIRELASKKYHDLLGERSLESVLMFLPVEGAFQLFMQHDLETFSKAMEKGILIVGPSNLMLTLRIIHLIWNREYQDRHATAIAQEAARFHDQVIRVLEDCAAIAKNLEQGLGICQRLQRRIQDGRGSIMSRLKKLEELGIQSQRKLPEQIPSFTPPSAQSTPDKDKSTPPPE